MVAPGTRIGEHVVLEEMIGGGALGVVWRGWHEAFACPVAVKLLVALDEEARERFDVEGKLIVRMSCPNIVRVLDCGHQDDVPYLVMELLDGETLLERLDRDGVLDADFVADIVEQVAEGLEHAHRRGVIHRDIKPDNIFLTHDDDGAVRAVIVDFGIAKPGWDMAGRKPTKAGTLMGSPSYMSPEQLVNSSAVTTASDTWSLAVVAFEAITGRVPFGMTEDITEVAMAILRRLYAPEDELARPLPTHLQPIFQQAFHADAGSQFRTPRAFARALSMSIEDAMAPVPLVRESKPADPPPLPPPPPVPERDEALPLASRWPLWAAAALMLGAAGWLWLSAGQDPASGAAAGVRAATPALAMSARDAVRLPMPASPGAPPAPRPHARARAPRAVPPAPAPPDPPPPADTPAPLPPPPLPTRSDYGF